MAEGHEHSHDGCADGCAVPDAGNDPRFARVLWAVLGINAAMFAIELAAGLGAGSVSLQADALDFLGDTLGYGISLLVVGRSLGWRASAALAKGAAMGGFGLWVVAATAWSLITRGLPDAAVMGSVGALALAANLVCAVLLYRFRGGDANMRSVWLCSRNDVIGNLAVLGAASGVFATGTVWPDLAVAAVMAVLSLHASGRVVRHAAAELAEVRAQS